MSIPLPISIKGHIRPAKALLLFGLALCCLSPEAGAQERKEPTPEERTLASALFDQGRELMEQSRYSEACPKLAESYRLDPGGGTLLNVALCHAREGKHATAWAEFREAQSIAVREGRQDRVDAAESEIQKLKPLLSYLSINVSTADAAPGLVISIDGAAISSVAWGTPFPVDPGRHVVIASAPEYAPYETAVDVSVRAETKAVSIPKLAKKWATAAPKQSADRGEQPSGTLRTLSYVAFGVGGVGVIAGSIFGIKAISTMNEANKICPDKSCSDPGAVEQSQDAKGFATLSNIGFGLGIAGLATGVILLLKSPSNSPPKATALRLDILPAHTGGRMSLSGHF